jgi:hypothetical protein
MAIKRGINALKVESLNGINFKMWKQKNSYILMHEKIPYTLTIEKPKLNDKKNEEVVKKQEKWMEDSLMARAIHLHNTKDDIISLFEGHEIAKDMMRALDKKIWS